MLVFRLLKWVFRVVSIVGVAAICVMLFFSFVDKKIALNEHSKTCLVTGASSGIGREIAREMIQRGWKVIAIARSEDKLKEEAREFGSSFIPYVCDVSDLEKIHAVSEDAKQHNLQPTLFFLNAGTGHGDYRFKFSQQAHHDTFNTNYFGVIAWVQEWLNDVKTYGGGTFIATSSVMSLFATPGAASYCASKAALNSCFQSLRLQYLNDNIGFSVVLPGPVDTHMLKGPARNMPFTHTAEYEGKYIVDQVMKGASQIEPSWVWAWGMRMLNWLPSQLVLKIVA